MIHVFLLLKILKLQKRHALKTLAVFSKRLQVQSVESCFISRSESQRGLSSISTKYQWLRIFSEGVFFTICIF